MLHLKDLLIERQISIAKTASLEEAVEKMYNNQQGVVVVVEDQFPVGIVTQKDILHLINSAQDMRACIEEIFHFGLLVTINLKRSIEYAVNLLIDNNIKRLIVVDDDGHFLGIVTQDKLVQSMEDESFRVNLLISRFIQDKSELVTLEQNSTIDKAFRVMQHKGIGSVIAVDTGLNPVGILTQRDVIYIASHKIDRTRPIKEVMSAPIICVKEDNAVKDVVDLMVEKKINQVLVLDAKTEEPISTLSIRDITHNLKGRYGDILEKKLKNIKETLNYIGESILEVHKDNDEQVIAWMNEKAVEKFGSRVDKSILTIFDKESWDHIYTQLTKSASCGKFKLNVDESYFEVTCSYHFSHAQETILLILKDISEFEYALLDAKKRSAELEHELKILQGVIDQQNNIVLVTDGKEIILTNKSFYRFFDVQSIEEFEQRYNGLSDTFINHQDFYSPRTKGGNWAEEILTFAEKERVVSIIDFKTMEPKAFTVQLNKLSSDIDHYVVTLTDITEIKLQSQQYYFNATHDALTRIYNRSFYLDKIQNELQKAKRYNSNFSVILFDIDHFKKFNDTYGHLKGDEVLVEVAQTVKQSIRSSDILARWGGEEFIILLPETTLDKAELLAENLRKRVSQIAIEGIGQVTASFGVAQFQPQDSDDTLIQRADEALYDAKSAGRNRVISK